MLALRAPAPPSMTFNQIAKYGSVEVSQTLNQVINDTFCLRTHFSTLNFRNNALSSWRSALNFYALTTNGLIWGQICSTLATYYSLLPLQGHWLTARSPVSDTFHPNILSIQCCSIIGPCLATFSLPDIQCQWRLYFMRLTVCRTMYMYIWSSYLHLRCPGQKFYQSSY